MSDPAVLAQVASNLKLYLRTFRWINKTFGDAFEKLDFQSNDDTRQSLDKLIATLDADTDMLFNALHINKLHTIQMLLNPLHRRIRDEAFAGVDFQSQDAKERIKKIMAEYTQDVGSLAEPAIGCYEVKGYTNVNGERYVEFANPVLGGVFWKFRVESEEFKKFKDFAFEFMERYAFYVLIGPILAKILGEYLLNWQKVISLPLLKYLSKTKHCLA